MGEDNELKNRYLIINAPDNWNIADEIETNTHEKLGKDTEDVLEKLGKKAKRLGKRLGKNRIEIVKLMYQNPSISSVEMAERIGISSTAIDNNIRQMRDVFVKRIGPKNGGHWEILID